MDKEPEQGGTILYGGLDKASINEAQRKASAWLEDHPNLIKFLTGS
jgi:hypothetical protein